MGAISTRGKCNSCGQPIAWRERSAAEQRTGGSKYALHDPERDAAGNVVYLQVSNGQGRVVNRPKPSATRHVCSSSGNAYAQAAAAVEKCRAINDGYMCTLLLGHSGQHEAHNTSVEICRTWTDEIV